MASSENRRYVQTELFSSSGPQDSCLRSFDVYGMLIYIGHKLVLYLLYKYDSNIFLLDNS